MRRACQYISTSLAAAVSVIVTGGEGAGSEAWISDGPPGHGETDAWVLILEDEFEGQELDTEVWVTCYWWDDGGCTNLGNDELQWYMPENVSVHDGTLRLTARHEWAGERHGRGFAYTSGMVTTGRAVDRRDVPAGLTFLFGYVEMRARFSAGAGLWPAFWLLPDDHQSRPEIDIMEIDGGQPGRLSVHLHYQHTNGDRDSFGWDCHYDDLSQDWHVYAVEWGPREVIWYLDGDPCWRFTDRDHIPTREPMYILINLAVGGTFVGPPDDDTAFPATFEIDWVRVWQRDNG